MNTLYKVASLVFKGSASDLPRDSLKWNESRNGLEGPSLPEEIFSENKRKANPNFLSGLKRLNLKFHA